jgi:hypothetical protein
MARWMSSGVILEFARKETVRGFISSQVKLNTIGKVYSSEYTKV